MKDEIDFGNEIIIAGKEPEKYVFAILKSLQPCNYERYGKIKIQTTMGNLQLADYVVGLFSDLWLEIESRKKKVIPITKESGEKYKLEVIEITLVLHPKLRR